MRLDRVLASIALIAIAVAFGDEPDWTIYLPDSLSGLMYSQCAAYNPVNDKVYVGGTGNCVIVIDCATNKKVARIPTKSGCSAIFCSPVGGKVYCMGGKLTVIDGVSDTVTKTLPVSRTAFCYNPRSEKLYAYGGPWGASSPTVIDTRTDSVVGDVGTNTASFCYNAHDDKVYSKTDGYVGDHNTVTILKASDRSFVANVELRRPVGPSKLCYNPASNKVYCADYGTKTVTVIDGTTNAVLATIAADSGLVDMCCNPRDNKIYLANGAHAPQPEERRGPPHDYGDATVTVIDGATDTVIATVSTHGRPFVLSYDSLLNKVAAACEGGSLGTSPDSLLAWPVPSQLRTPGGSGLRAEPKRGPTVDIIDGASNQLTASAVLTQATAVFCFGPKRGNVYCVGRDRDHSGVVALDMATGRMLANLRTGRSPGALCCNSRHNKMYCTIPVDSELMVLDGATNHVRARASLGRMSGRLCYNSRNDKLYCQVSQTDKVKVLDGKTEKVKAEADMGVPMWYDPKNNRVYSFRGFHAIVATDGATDSTIAEIPFHEPGALCSNPRTSTVYCTGRDGVAVIDGRASSLLTTVRIPDGVNVICCDCEDNKVYCAGPYSHALFAIDGATNRVDTALPLHGSTTALCYNSRNNKIYSSGNHGIRVFDPATDSVVARFSEYSGIGSMVYDPVNNCVYCVGGGKVVVLDGATDKMLRTYDVGRGSYSLAFNMTQNRVYLYTTDRGGTSIYALDGNKIQSGSYGGLQVSSEPSCVSISIDGTETGKTTPSLFRKVAAGQTSLGLTTERYPGWDSTVMVIPGQTATVKVALKLPQDSLWITNAQTQGAQWEISTGPERAVRFSARHAFGFPLRIAGVSAVFYSLQGKRWAELRADSVFRYKTFGYGVFQGKPWTEPWPDSSFRFKIYGNDGQTLLYQSPVLEAIPGEPGPAVVHELGSPVSIDSGEFYVAVAPLDTSGWWPTMGVQGRRESIVDSELHSYAGAPGHWTPLRKNELSVAVLVRR